MYRLTTPLTSALTTNDASRFAGVHAWPGLAVDADSVLRFNPPAESMQDSHAAYLPWPALGSSRTQGNHPRSVRRAGGTLSQLLLGEKRACAHCGSSRSSFSILPTKALPMECLPPQTSSRPTLASVKSDRQLADSSGTYAASGGSKSVITICQVSPPPTTGGLARKF